MYLMCLETKRKESWKQNKMEGEMHRDIFVH